MGGISTSRPLYWTAVLKQWIDSNGHNVTEHITKGVVWELPLWYTSINYIGESRVWSTIRPLLQKQIFPTYWHKAIQVDGSWTPDICQANLRDWHAIWNISTQPVPITTRQKLRSPTNSSELEALGITLDGQSVRLDELFSLTTIYSYLI
ncbi:hypothetical protein A0J61_09882 [Choanephora cucurbitarum]|uniref:Uncharacterized protein n=1 Tax=Choanephora cucurbitarum TaxID=101091 RepID=A0A1C7MZ67_9FUNG|nr:hypothetical protein A0J61_09882 [Choanephora cucurbitarum]